ncbi:MAG TPA: hypothetical protein VGP46_08610, partial [Acidimicrobiales bacterium]|nr:hypothetical protein [Acidimicrobiales bacterium]
MAETEPSNRYRLGPRSTRGLIAGWSTGQVLCVAGGLVFGLMVMRSVGGGLGLVMATFATSFGLA